MNANDITSRVFEKSGFKGYKSDEVDEYLREIAQEFSLLQRERNELERKLEVLADKIREYRKDEEALKEALLGAHRQGNLLVNEATTRSEAIVKEAEEKASIILDEAEEKSQKQVNSSNEYVRKTIEEANFKASRIVGEANRKADEIKKKISSDFDTQNQIIIRTAQEAKEFRLKLLGVYKEQVELINQLPDIVENAYVKQIISDSAVETVTEISQVQAENEPVEFAQNIVTNSSEISENVVDNDDKKPLENVNISEPETENKPIDEVEINDKSTENKPEMTLTQEFNEVFKPNTKINDEDAFFS